MKNKKTGPRTLTDSQMRKKYRDYLKDHEEREQKLNRRGYIMQSPADTFKAFEGRYITAQNNRYALKMAGKIKNVGNITKFLVSEDAYGGKFKQAQALLKAGFVKGASKDWDKMSVKERIEETMRIATLEDWEYKPEKGEKSEYIDWDRLKAEYRELVALYGPKKAGEKIHQMYFPDSP